MSDRSGVKQREEYSLHKGWGFETLGFSYCIAISFPQIWGKGKEDCKDWGTCPERMEGQCVTTAETHTATVKTSEVEPKPQIQFCFSANRKPALEQLSSQQMDSGLQLVGTGLDKTDV